MRARVVAFAGDRELQAQSIGPPRFTFVLPLPPIAAAGGDLRVFGIAGGHATRLRPTPGVERTLASLSAP